MAMRSEARLVRFPDPRPDLEAALLRRVARGEEAALVALYARVAGTVYASCLRIVGDPEDAREVASETFWRVWSRASSFDPGRCSGMVWIATIARRLAIDRRRQLQRRGRLWRSAAAQPVETGRRDDHMLARWEMAEALARLAPRDRQLLESAYFEGLTGRDIASRDELPLGTVKSRMRAALIRLRLSFRRGEP
jgi:RNA polymerase sigma-70 factor (ECF subfamily)